MSPDGSAPGASPGASPGATDAVRLDDDQVREVLGSVDAALAELESLPPPAARTALEAVESVVRLYREAMARVVDRLAPEGPELLADDPLVGHLLLLHGLHPHPLERRVADAVERARPYAQSSGGDLALAGIDGGVARVRLSGGGGCSTAALHAAVEEAVLEMAPELDAVQIDETPGEAVIPVEAIVRRSAEKAGRAVRA